MIGAYPVIPAESGRHALGRVLMSQREELTSPRPKIIITLHTNK